MAPVEMRGLTGAGAPYVFLRHRIIIQLRIEASQSMNQTVWRNIFHHFRLG